MTTVSKDLQWEACSSAYEKIKFAVDKVAIAVIIAAAGAFIALGCAAAFFAYFAGIPIAAGLLAGKIIQILGCSQGVLIARAAAASFTFLILLRKVI